MNITYEVIDKNKFDKYQKIFKELLEKQGKVQGDYSEKIYRCKLVCIVKANDTPIAMGAIKKKTLSDFSKANLPELEKDFSWELGYFYTDEEYQGKGISSNITKMIIQAYGNFNLMASTEISANPSMVKILEKNGFRLFGTPWKSGIHDNYLGLFLKYM